MWGTCDDGTEAVGCGKPETFRNCADISIITSAAGLPPIFVQQDNPFLLYYRDYNSPNIFPLIVRYLLLPYLQLIVRLYKLWFSTMLNFWFQISSMYAKRSLPSGARNGLVVSNELLAVSAKLPFVYLQLPVSFFFFYYLGWSFAEKSVHSLLI